MLAPIVLAVALVMPADAAPRPWTLVRTKHVTVVGQQPARVLRNIAVQVEQFRAALGSLIRGGGPPPAMPTIVYAFDDRAALEPYLPLYDGKPSAVAGYCHCGSPTSPNIIAASLASFADSSAVVFHEYTHVLVGNAAAAVPVWLNEGLAEFYSSFAITGTGRTIEIGRPLEHHLQLLRRRGTLPIRELLAVDASSPLYNERSRRSLFYAEAWALTHYLLIGRPDGPAAVNRYLTAVGAGEAPLAAFAAAFGESPEHMDVVFGRYVRRPVLRTSVLPLGAGLDAEEPEDTRVLPAVEAEARLAGLQLGVQRTAEAAPRIEAAASAGPAVPEAQLALGLLRIQQQRMADAWAPLERAAALAPDDFTTQLTYALMLLRHDVDDRERARPSIERARAALIRALAVNPQSADALAWQAFADLLLDSHIDEAHEAIARAVALAPGRLEFRIREAEVLLREQRDEQARSILASVAGSRTDAEAAREAESLLSAIRERDRRLAARAAALAAADSHPAPGGDPASSGASGDADAAAASPGRRIVLRTVRPGEERAYGDLVSIDCSEAGVRFEVRVGSRTIAAAARRITDVTMKSYLGDPAVAVSCGTRIPPDVVFLTWRMPSPTRPAQPGIVGEAVALEFVPRDYIP